MRICSRTSLAVRRAMLSELMKVLTNPDEREDARRRLAELLDSRVEWFCAETREDAALALGRGEWEIETAHGALCFSYRTARGAERVWRVAGWEWTGERLRLEATRRMGATRALLELVPRASVREGVEALAAARRAACERLAALVCEATAHAKVERATLSAGARRSEPGRYARIILRVGREPVAVTGAVVALGAHEVDAFLASALIWRARAGERRKRDTVRKLWLVVAHELKDATAGLLALLGEDVRREISLYETSEGWQSLSPVALPSLAQSLDGAARFCHPPRVELTETASRIAALAPEAIDMVRARHGETLRFHGLPFARVRSLVGHERAWFGAGRASRVLLDEGTWPQLIKLVAELREHRRAAAVDHRHVFYASAPEAWLESLLRRDITRLDPGLRLAPLYAQFRTSRDKSAGARPVDLLALRHDGRLVVIELKVSEDAALPLQGADYWRRISAYHRDGHIKRARLFGDAEISGDAPLVYLVAPLLRFHRSFQTLARCISTEIEMYRFDINEDWRAGVRAMRRVRVV
ncbi:MAG TPA: hypothetical protein VER76_20275 [Pyrinomonadaceae bacterium]|nr:hypothetical protein [Pyrinomonadaceae bacterium]